MLFHLLYVLKPGRITLILWNNSIRVLYSRHVAIKCSSLSTVCKRVAQFPSSTCNSARSLSFVNYTRTI